MKRRTNKPPDIHLSDGLSFILSPYILCALLDWYLHPNEHRSIHRIGLVLLINDFADIITDDLVVLLLQRVLELAQGWQLLLEGMAIKGRVQSAL